MHILITCVVFSIIIINTAHCSSNCPSNENCFCSHTPDGYDIACPKTFIEPLLMAQISPGKLINLHCSFMNHSHYELLFDFQIGDIEGFIFKLCPLPLMPFIELFDKMGVTKVTKLHFQSYGNLSSTLHFDHLKNLKNLKTLRLDANALTKLSEDLFHDLNNLTSLDLKNNKVILSTNIFRPISGLEVLELGANNLTYLPQGIFRNLTRLRLLNLWSNNLKNLTRSIFSDVPNLEKLDLNSNGINNLMPDLFADLTKLNELNLMKNDFVSMPSGLFLGTPNLEKLRMGENARVLTTLPHGFLKNLTKLTDLLIDSCNMRKLPQDLIWGSISLTTLSLKSNNFTWLPSELLRDAVKLTNLDLSKNKLKELPEGFFAGKTNLKKIDISYNLMVHLSDKSFLDLTSLEELYLRHNEIEKIDGDAFLRTSNLRIINLSDNKLSNIGTAIVDPAFGAASVFQQCKNLNELYLARNNISEIYRDWRISRVNLRILDLKENNFMEIMFDDIHFVSSGLVLDLSFNHIKTIELSNAEIYAREIFDNSEIEKTSYIAYDSISQRFDRHVDDRSVRIHLKGNPLHCDCQNFQLVRYFHHEMPPEVYSMINLDPEGLTCASPINFKEKNVAKIHAYELTCPVPDTSCPKQCNCSFRPYDKGFIVDCSKKFLTAFPEFKQDDESIGLYTNHTELDLSFNKIRKVPEIFPKGYERITKLKLSHNNLTDFNISNLSNQLEILELDGNNITEFNTQTLQILQNLKSFRKLTLHSNPWVCDCKIKNLLDFLQFNYKKVDYLQLIKCSGSKIPLSNLTANDVCPTSYLTKILLVGVALLGFIIGGLFGLYYRFQQEIKVWLYANNLCLWFVTEEELDKDKVYDAFISYSNFDADFVENKLVPSLEEEGPIKYKLCLHYRDWLVGDLIPVQISRSVEESRRTIVVLSRNFVDSVWTKMEFRTAHSQALTDKRVRVLVIIYGDISPIENLDPELRAYLNTNTYVKWGDPWFWDKLRYALPHSNKIKLHGKHNSKINNEKIMLNSQMNLSNDKTKLVIDDVDSPKIIDDSPIKTSNGETDNKASVNLKVIECC